MSCKVKTDCTTLRCASNEMIITAKKEVFGETLSGLTWIGNLPITIDGNGNFELSMELGAEGMTHHLSSQKVHFKGLVEITANITHHLFSRAAWQALLILTFLYRYIFKFLMFQPTQFSSQLREKIVQDLASRPIELILAIKAFSPLLLDSVSNMSANTTDQERV